MADAMRVLFVEDHEEVRGLVCELLEEDGLRVVACASAEEAEAEFDRAVFDLVLTDVSLPAMSGTDLARRLLAKRPDTWIVFLSGYPMHLEHQPWGPRVRSLLKPFDPGQLQALMEDIRSAGGA